MKQFSITTQEAKDLVAGLDAVTDKIAAKLQKLIDQISANGLSAMDEDALKAELQRVTDALNAIGADPVDPIPDPDPVP